jgi:hypothetical protein
MTEDNLADLAAKVTVQPGGLDAADPAVSAVAHLELKSIAFRQEADHHVQQITYVAVLFDSKGGYVAGAKAVIDFALTGPNLQRLTEAGINCTLLLRAPPGSYRLRTVVRDESGRMAAGNQAVEVR